MNNYIRDWFAISLLAAGIQWTTLAQNSWELPVITSCGYVEATRNNTTRKMEECFVKIGEKVMYLHEWESIRVGMYMYTRNWNNITRKFVWQDQSEIDKNLANVEKCMVRARTFDDKLACLK